MLSYSCYSYSETTVNLIPFSSLTVQGNVKVSPGDPIIFGKAGGSVYYSSVFNEKLFRATNIPVKISGLEYGWEYSLGCSECINYLSAKVILTSKTDTVYIKNYMLTGSGIVQEKVSFQELLAKDLDRFSLSFSGQQTSNTKPWTGPTINNPYYKLAYEPIVTEKPVILPKETYELLPESVYIDPVKDSLPRLVENPIAAQVLETPEPLQTYTPTTLNRGSLLKPAEPEKPKPQTTSLRISTRQPQANQESTRETVTISTIIEQAPSLQAYQQATLPDSTFYVVKDIYKNVKPIDNQRLLRGLTRGSNITHKGMVDEQYK